MLLRCFNLDYNIKVHRIVRQKKGDDQYIKRHKHEYFHYIYILNGEGRVLASDSEYNVKKYDLVLIPPDIEHEIYGKKNLISLDIKFNCNKELEETLKTLPYYVKCVTKYEDNLIKKIFEEAVKQQYMYKDIINTMILELLFNIIRRNKYGSEKTWLEENMGQLPVNNSEFYEVKEAIDYIEKNIYKPIKVSFLAEICGFNAAYFSTLFKKIMGISPARYINTLKCQKAKELMFYTDKNITEISQYMGYETVHYFSKVFKKITGRPPKSYLNKDSEDIIINIEKSTLPEPNEFEIPMMYFESTNINNLQR